MKKKSPNADCLKKYPIFASVEKLGKHIETLLRENDCVILPGFGGFIVHPVAARYIEEERLFFPPARTVAFNDRLTENDGLLAHSYMSENQVGYHAACRMMEKAIDALSDTLAAEGEASLPGVGTFQQDIKSNIRFTADQEIIETPFLTGLDAVGMSTLAALQADRELAEAAVPSQPVITTSQKTIDIHIGKRFIHTISAAAAAVLLLVLFALPMSKDQQPNMAGLPMNTGSMKATTATTVSASSDSPAESRTSYYPFETYTTTKEAPEAPSVSEEAPEAKELAEDLAASTVEAPEKTYHIIIASLPSEQKAEPLVKKYTDKGFPDTHLLKIDSYVRVALASYTDKDEALRHLRELRREEVTKHAWILTEKNQ